MRAPSQTAAASPGTSLATEALSWAAVPLGVGLLLSRLFIRR